MIDLDSSTISKVDYIESNQILKVIFKNKAKIVYSYSNVPKEIFNTFILSTNKSNILLKKIEVIMMD